MVKNEKVIMQDSIKYLGVTIDRHINWKEQSNNILKELNAFIPLIYKIRNKLSKENKKLIYLSMIENKISYSIDIWGAANKTNMKKIQRKQKVILRILYNKGRRDEITELMRENKFLNVYAITLNKLTKIAWRTLRCKEKRDRMNIREIKRDGKPITRKTGQRGVKQEICRTEREKRSVKTRIRKIINQLEEEGQEKIHILSNAEKEEKYPKRDIKTWWNEKVKEDLVSNYW